MNSIEIYDQSLKSVVAIVDKRKPDPQSGLPAIVATGFVVRPNGLIATNQYVVRHIDEVIESGSSKNSFGVLYFSPGKDNAALLNLDVLDIHSYFLLDGFETELSWFGDENPDIGFLQLAVTDLAAVELATSAGYLRPGDPVITAGFPLGDTVMHLHNGLTHAGPLLRSGIISGVFPFATNHPDGFVVDIMIQGGASGSPVYSSLSGNVVGMLSHSLIDTDRVSLPGGGEAILRQNTNLSLGFPSFQLKMAVDQVPVHQDVHKFPTLCEWQASGDRRALNRPRMVHK